MALYFALHLIFMQYNKKYNPVQQIRNLFLNYFYPCFTASKALPSLNTSLYTAS